MNYFVVFEIVEDNLTLNIHRLSDDVITLKFTVYKVNFKIGKKI